jgi:hypothetical protein
MNMSAASFLTSQSPGDTGYIGSGGSNLQPVSLSGVFAISTTTTSNVVIPIPGMTGTGAVVLSYITPGSGAGQWITSVSTGTNLVSISTGITQTSNDSIIWLTNKLQ